MSDSRQNAKKKQQPMHNTALAATKNVLPQEISNVCTFWGKYSVSPAIRPLLNPDNFAEIDFLWLEHAQAGGKPAFDPPQTFVVFFL